MPKFVRFCYVCKKHVTMNADNQGAAAHEFSKFGHDDEKVAKLQRGMSGKTGVLNTKP